MTEKANGHYNHKKYQNEYHKGMKTKLISFNPNNPNDMKLWEYLQTKENKTGYIKDLIRLDMDGRITIDLKGIPITSSK